MTKKELVESGIKKIARKYMAEAVSPKSLDRIIAKIPLGSETSLPMSQGMAIKEVIKQYKIPAIEWGYSGNYNAVATKKQIMVWNDNGTHL